jgi:serpin B
MQINETLENEKVYSFYWLTFCPFPFLTCLPKTKFMSILNRLLIITSIIFFTGTQFSANAQSQNDCKAAVKMKSDDQLPVSEAINNFAFNLYSLISKEENNAVFSPYSISAAMAMTGSGAAGQTYDEIRKVFFFGNKQTLPQRFKNFTDTLFSGSTKEGLILKTANSLWIQENFPLLPQYRKTLDSFFYAPINRVNYLNADTREKARLDINQWVEANTNQKIKELIKPNILDELTRLVLTNAIYFYGSWEKAFDKNLTADSNFRTYSKVKVQIPYMHQSSTYSYFEDSTLQLVELPYATGRQAMIILLPNDTMNFASFEKQLTYQSFQKWMHQTTPVEINISFPKFTTKQSYALENMLPELGLQLAFTDYADFSGITGHTELKISKVIHQSFIEVNENGTEASAATGVVMRLKSMNIKRPKILCIDHPFVYFIYDYRTKSILFMGRMMNPAK